MRVLVCGDRNWKDWKFLYSSLNIIHHKTPITVLIEGEARGADSFARNWAHSLGIKVDPYPAEWHKFRHAAGPIRNKKMLVEGKPQLVVAFHSNIEESKGTKNMVELAQKAGIPVVVLSNHRKTQAKQVDLDDYMDK